MKIIYHYDMSNKHKKTYGTYGTIIIKPARVRNAVYSMVGKSTFQNILKDVNNMDDRVAEIFDKDPDFKNVPITDPIIDKMCACIDLHEHNLMKSIISEAYANNKSWESVDNDDKAEEIYQAAKEYFHDNKDRIIILGGRI